MKKLLFAFLLLGASQLFAHPMGNFSINHYASISFEEKNVRLHYIIDMAEIPTFQEMSKADLNGDRQVSDLEGAEYAKKMASEWKTNLRLKIDGAVQDLQRQQSRMQTVPGAGGLPTFVFRIDYLAFLADAKSRTQLSYEDHNFPDRLGWKEIVVHRGKAQSLNGDLSEYVDRSKELTEYPADPTSSAPQETSIQFGFQLPAIAMVEKVTPVAQPEGTTTNTVVAASVPPAKVLQSEPVTPKREDRFTRLITAKDLSAKVIMLSLMIAFALGAMHAMSPGHGKTIVAGYLVGSRGTAYHAIFLGAVVTLTHTVGVFALGLLTLFGSRYIMPERLYPWLGFLSGVSIVVIGATMFRKRLRALNSKKEHHHHNHEHHEHVHEHHHDHGESEHHHDGGHHHDHDHGHSHLPVDAQTGEITWKSLLTIGVSGGALPCPSALVVLLSAISLHRVGFGLLLIVAFSLGLALVLTSIGLLLVYASSFTQRFHFSGKLLQRMPLASSLIIAVLGFAIAVQALNSL